MTDSVLVRGGGEMATGVAVALVRAGCLVVVTETERPRAIRRTVAVAEAVRCGSVTVESIVARNVRMADISERWDRAEVAVVVDPDLDIRRHLNFTVLVDAIMSKRNAGGTGRDWAPLVIGLGPGFTAGANCHLVVETARGHYLGRFYDRGSALPDTGVPGELGGESAKRIVRAPASGILEPVAAIGDRVKAGARLASVAGIPVSAPLDGVLRGLLAGGLDVAAGEKIGDVDPRGCPEYCRYIAEKARQIGSAVLSAMAWNRAGRPGKLPPPPTG